MVHIDPASKPEVRDLTQEAQSLVALAGSYRIQTTEEYAAAAEDLKRIKGAKSRLSTLRKSMTAPLDQAKKAVMDFFREPENQLDQAESRIKSAMVEYTEEQERIAREEQARQEEAARKERERLEAQARKAEASGKVEKADVLQQRAASVVAPIVRRDPPKVTGISTREVWRFEVIDPAKVPREYLMVDEAKIRKVVGALKGDTRIDGVRVWSEKSVAAGKA